MCSRGREGVQDAEALAETPELLSADDNESPPSLTPEVSAGTWRREAGEAAGPLCRCDNAGAADSDFGEGADATGTRTQSSPPTHIPKDPEEGPGRCCLSRVPRDLPRTPFLLGFGRRPPVTYEFGSNP